MINLSFKFYIMVSHIGYMYLILKEIGLKKILVIIWIVYLGRDGKNFDNKIRALLLCKEPDIKNVIRKWSRLWSLCNGICHVSSVGENQSLSSYNVSLIRQHLVICLEKEMIHPFPKQGSTKRVLICRRKSTITKYFVQYASMKKMIQWMSAWAIMNDSTRNAKKYLVKTSWTSCERLMYVQFTSCVYGEKYQFLSLFGKLYYKNITWFYFYFT